MGSLEKVVKSLRSPLWALQENEKREPRTQCRPHTIGILLGHQALRMVKMKFASRKKLRSCIRLCKPCVRIILGQGFCSLSTVEGRKEFAFYYPEYFHKYDGWKIKSTILLFRKNEKEFYLGIVVQREIEIKAPSSQVLGIDRGLRNLTVTSDNRFFNSKKINAVRGRFAYYRAQLQAKGTRSA